MYTHTIHNGLILRNVRVEIVHETNPVFADEEVSAIIRFRHLGQSKKHENQEKQVQTKEPKEEETDATTTNSTTGEQKENVGPNDTGNGWFGKRLSLQLGNTARSLFLEQLEKEETKEQKKAAEIDQRDLPVDLITGYVQLSGFFTYDTDVIEHEKVDGFRKKAAVSGKIGGLEGLEISKTNNGGLLSLISGVGSLFNSSVDNLKIDDNRENVNTDNLVPFFSTSQSLLFSQIHLEPGEVQTFYFKCKLPKELPPSYSGNSISITYHTVVGAALDEQFPKPLNVHFPLRVSSFFDNKGYQPISNLDQFILLPSNKIFNELVLTNNTHYRRRSSFRTIKNYVLVQPELSQIQKQKKFINKMKELIENESAQIPPIEEFVTPKVKDVITTFCESSLETQEIDENEPKLIKIDDFRYEKQITKFQTQYKISKNSNSITTLTFSKPFYKIGEQIRLSFDLKDQTYKITGILISLENLELIKESYSIDPEENKKKPRSVVHFKESFTTFNLDNLSVSIPIPLNATSQFKTNIFESKWCIYIKLIMTKEDNFLEEIHSDDAGVFKFAKENLSGEDFKIRLPVIVLPCDQDFGGIPV